MKRTSITFALAACLVALLSMPARAEKLSLVCTDPKGIADTLYYDIDLAAITATDSNGTFHAQISATNIQWQEPKLGFEFHHNINRGTGQDQFMTFFNNAYQGGTLYNCQPGQKKF